MAYARSGLAMNIGSYLARRAQQEGYALRERVSAGKALHRTQYHLSSPATWIKGRQSTNVERVYPECFAARQPGDIYSALGNLTKPLRNP